MVCWLFNCVVIVLFGDWWWVVVNLLGLFCLLFV